MGERKEEVVIVTVEEYRALKGNARRSKKIPLPCPFCGQAYSGIVPKEDRVECPFCGAMGPFPTGGKRGETPVEAWNLRVKHVLAPRKPRAKKKGEGDGKA